MSNILIGADQSGSYRFYITNTTDLVADAHAIHDTTPLASAALGRTLTGCGLMSVMMKNPQDRLTIQFRGDGPARQIIACGYGDGRVRGYIADPTVQLPLNSRGKLDVGGAIGSGELTVIRDSGMKEPYVGKVALVSGEIAEDLTAYYYLSEQQNTSFALGVKTGREGRILAAGGMFLQMLPDADEAAAGVLEDLLAKMEPITTIVETAMLRSAGRTEEENLEDMMHMIFDPLPPAYAPEILGYADTRWECDCSRERMAQALMTIGKKELTTLIEEDGQAELQCHFCNKKYLFDRAALEAIRDGAGGSK
ncbi:MAG: Hsp33 family molecular chaperone HslO [Eubacteriales bacterium]|nr:Hsp33 family molecular chaperone HslO [Eubacteriales bacterium]